MYKHVHCQFPINWNKKIYTMNKCTNAIIHPLMLFDVISYCNKTNDIKNS